MARCMLFDVDINIKYWAEAVNNANYIQNRLISSVVDVTPYELWFGESPNFVHVNKQKRRKLNEVADKCRLLGYADESKGFRLLKCNTNQVIISRDVKFLEYGGGSSIDVKAGGGDSSGEMTNAFLSNLNDDVIETPTNEGPEEEDAISSEDFLGFTSAEDFSSSSDSEVNIEPCPTPRISSRSNKGIPSKKYGYKACTLTDPVSYNEAVSRPDCDMWLKAMKDEMKALHDNETWDLVELPPNGKLTGCKWVFKTKQNINGVKKYRARLVARGFSQKYGESYDEIFAPVVKQTSFRALLAIASNRRMKVYHIDIKTAFLYGELYTDIFINKVSLYLEKVLFVN